MLRFARSSLKGHRRRGSSVKKGAVAPTLRLGGAVCPPERASGDALDDVDEDLPEGALAAFQAMNN